MGKGDQPGRGAGTDGDASLTDLTTPGLELDDDITFQCRDWRVQRWGRTGMLLLLVAALAGLLGPGPISERTAGVEGGPLWVEYLLFGRWLAPEVLRVHLGPGRAPGGRASLWLDRALADRYDISDVSPPPEGVTVWSDRLEYHFRAPDPDREIEITFERKPSGWGLLGGRVGVPGGPSVEIREIVYP